MLNIPAAAGYPPIYKNPLFQKKKKESFPCSYRCPLSGKEIDYASVFCPRAEKASQQTVWLPHRLLLAPEEEMEDVIMAIQKIRAVF